MRTELLLELQKELSGTNEHLASTMFISRQFLADNTALLQQNPDAFSGSLYSANPLASRFNRRSRDIPDFINSYQNSMCRHLFISIYSHLAFYIESVIKKANLIDNNIHLDFEGFFVEKRNPIIGNIWSVTSARTLDYIRLRRNSLVHGDGSMQKTLKDIVKSHGDALNQFWRSSKRTLDFTDQTVRDLSPNDIIGTILITKVLSKKIDEATLSVMNKQAIIDHILTEFRMHHPSIKSKSRQRVDQMFAAVALRSFGLRAGEIDYTRVTYWEA